MSTWRRKAIALFPQHRLDFARPDFPLHEVFSRLEMDAQDAHVAEMDGDPVAVRTLQRIHGFAEWCLHQGGQLWTSAAVGFYEDLFGLVPWDRIVPWVSPYVIDQIKATWALGVGREGEPKFDELVRIRPFEHYRQHVYSTGEIEHL